MSISKPWGYGIAVLACLAAHAGEARPRLDQPTAPTISETGSAYYRFTRLALTSSDGGRTYDIQVGIPRHAPPLRGCRVIYMLDGGAAIEALDEPVLARLDASGDAPVLVALGYAGQPRFDVKARALDYTPPVPGQPEVVDDQGRAGGGAKAFLDLLERMIVPRVEKLAPVDPGRRTLWGHSYGGLFVLYAAQQPRSRFNDFVAADPALWWNYGSFLANGTDAKASAVERALRTITFMVGGGKSSDGAPARRTPNAMRASLPPDATAGLARAWYAQGLHVTFWQCLGQSHGAMFPLSLRETLLGRRLAEDPQNAPLCLPRPIGPGASP